MPTFEFNDGVTVGSSGPSAPISISFTDDGVNFTLSTSGNGGINGANYIPGNVANLGLFSVSDFGTLGSFTLDLTGTNNLGPDGGNITVKVGDLISGAWNFTLLHATNAALNEQFTGITLTDDSLIFSTTEEFSGVRFVATSPGAIVITSLTASIVCYLAGTGIATPQGRVAVEDLRPGDTILTADGGTTTVRWVGVQPVDTATATPAKTYPICLRAGSLAPGVPERDLYVSPDHAMELDGLLVNAAALVNGRSIYQMRQMPQDGFTYYHVDTGTHELLLAEGAASETYIDAVGRDAFVNGDEMAAAPMILEMTVPRIVARRMLPADLKAQLDARADALGLVQVDAVA